MGFFYVWIGLLRSFGFCIGSVGWGDQGYGGEHVDWEGSLFFLKAFLVSSDKPLLSLMEQPR